VRGDFESTQVNVPPLPEQRSIVDLLSRAEGIVRLRREAEKKAAELIPALFLDMFGDPGANPKGWKTVPTGEVVQLTNGRAFKPAEWSDEGTPIIRIQNLNDPSKPFNYYAGDLPEKYKVRAGDVLLSWSGTPGTSFGCFRWQREDGWLNQHIFNVRVAEHINEDFFIHQINLQLPELIGRAHGGVGLQHFTKGALESLPFIVPTTTEQERFGEQAAQADSIQQQQAAATAKAQAAFDALLSGAFSG
jgi:type I restriction enzyme S subunit